MQSPPLAFEFPAALWTALALVLIGILAAAYRRPALPLPTKLLGVIGMLILAAAAGAPTWRRDRPEPVVVMVDLSPSTRGARYRDPEALRVRVSRLLGQTPYRMLYFAGGDGGATGTPEDSSGRALADMPARRTVFRPPAARAVVVFSDGRFDLPTAAPPTYVVVDPELEQPADAAVERIEIRGDQIVATIRNTGQQRSVTLGGTGNSLVTTTVPAGGIVLSRPVPDGTSVAVTGRLSPGDAWPENDALTLVPPPTADAPRWWVGGADRPAAEGWWRLSPQELPSDAAAYLSPPVIVLDNVAASDLTETQAQRLRQYVRDLGGGLVVAGGDRAFAAGGYAGTVLDVLSPLASHPPQPLTQWVFLVDSSGSMNAPSVTGSGTRWRTAVDAVAAAAPSLPPHDPVSVAGFAAGLEWWTKARPAGELRADTLPPAGARPSGPTELRRALAAAATSVGGGPPVELIALTDANAPVGNAADLAATLRQHKVRLHLLDLAEPDAAGLADLRAVVVATGGTLLREREPGNWAAAVRRLTRAATPDLLGHEGARVRFSGALAGTPDRSASPPWNRTWLKPEASLLAEIATPQGPFAAAAVWEVGEGRVTAAGFAAGGEAQAAVEALVRLVARAPRDPRVRAEWDVGPRVRVRVDAVERDADGTQRVLNGLALTLETRDGSEGGAGAAPAPQVVPQVAPGRYELELDAPDLPSLATLRQSGRAVERVAVAGRYAPEYDGVGNDRAAMVALAERTGGSIIEPSDMGPLRLPSAVDNLPLTSPVAAAAAACVALALLWWRAA